MNTYHKIQSIYKRDPNNKYRTFLHDQYSTPEFRYLRDSEWLFDEKVDGQNIRIMYQLSDTIDPISIRGKTDKADPIKQDLVDYINNIFTLSKFKDIFGDSPTCLYGEGYGAGIQKGGCYSATKSFVLFDIKVNHVWLPRSVVDVISKSFDCDIVPVIGTGKLDDVIKLCREGFKSSWGDFIAEGIVARPVVEMLDLRGRRVITKCKHRDFKYEN